MDKTSSIKQLLKEYKDGNNSAFRQLMLLTYKSLYSLSFHYLKDHMLAEDAVSDAYLKIVEKIHTIRNEQNLNGYLRTIVINRSFDILRKRKKEFSIDGEEAADDQQMRLAESDEDSKYVKDTLLVLNSDEREVLLLWQYGYTLREISDKTNFTINQVRLLLDKAKRNFSEKYHKNR